MADDKKIEDVFERMQKMQERQERVAYKLNLAMDDLSETALKKLTADLKATAKQTGLLNDEQLDLIKSSKDLTDAIEQQEKIAEEVTKAQIKYRASLREAAEQDKKGFWQSKNTLKLAEEQYSADLSTLKLTRSQADQIVHTTAAFKDHSRGLAASATSLDHFTKHIDDAKSSVKGWVAQNISLTASFELLKKAALQQIDELNKATAVGLQTSFAAIGIEAVKLKMSFDEFNELISKNRDVIRNLGGGVEGVKNFSRMIKETSSDLAYMGKDGIAATGRFFTTLKTMGVGSKDAKNFNEAMKSTQKHFTEFQGLWGDSYDQFADLIESQMEGASVQAKLTGLNAQESKQVREEIMLRTENMKAMGLSNDQIKTFSARLEDTADPRKTNYSQKASESVATQAYIQQVVAANPENKALQAAASKLINVEGMVLKGAADR